MPVYNGERWLESSALSVIEQNFSDLELVIVDDGSLDKTPDIVAELTAADRRVRSLRKENSGIADSLNQGIAAARGEWICRLDADDLALPDRIERQLALATANPSAVLIGGDLATIDSDGSVVRAYSYPTEHNRLVKQLVHGGRFFAHSAIMFRRDRAVALGGYRRRITRAEDHDLWMRLAETGTLHSVGTKVIHYRLHEAQASYLDGGIRQSIDKLIAVTSYHLRRLGQADPVDGSDLEFSKYRSFVEERAAASRLADLITFQVQLAKKRREAGTGVALAGIARAALIDPSLILRLVRSTLGADRTAIEAAQCWMKLRPPRLADPKVPTVDPGPRKTETQSD
jgi:glycosyltransferase involved in cell wall biosynthesis